jgi:hypothetical protein
VKPVVLGIVSLISYKNMMWGLMSRKSLSYPAFLDDMFHWITLKISWVWASLPWGCKAGG